MIICPKCNSENPSSGVKFCPKCGESLSELTKTTENQDSAGDDDLEFVVTEATDAPAPDFLGSDKKTPDSNKSGDQLEIKTSADILEDQTSGEIELEGAVGADPNLLRPDNENTFPESPKPAPPQASSSASPYGSGTDSADKNPRKKLSEKELANIRRNMYGSDIEPPRKLPEAPDEVSKKDFGASRVDIKKKQNTTDKPRPVKKINDPSKEGKTVKKSPKVRGIALFRKNNIKIVGNPFLHAGDELIVNEKFYTLRPKTVDKKVIIGAVGGFVALLLIIFAVMVTNKPALSGKGEIIGMILDNYGQPYLEGARVTIPYLDKTTTSNAQGFFRFEMIPTGAYELTYELGDLYIGQGNATVSGGQLTIMTFGDLMPVAKIEKRRPRPTAPPVTTKPKVTPTKVATSSSQTSAVAPPPQPSANKKKSATTSKKSKSSYGKIKLEANIENARLMIDGKVVGAGNNTYSKIKTGRHKIKVDKPGYQDYSEQVNIKSGKTFTVKAKLARNESAPTKLTADNYLSRGRDSYAAGDNGKAISDYTKALELSPSLVAAYRARGDAYLKNGDKKKATSDYIRLGEIYRMKKDYDNSISSFSSAIDLSPKNINALVGRGGSQMEKGNYQSGCRDFETTLRIDDKFYPALSGLGICYFKSGKHKRAEKYLKKAFKRDDSDPFLYQYIMLNYLARDNIGKVRSTYADFKAVADPQMLAEFKASNRSQPILRLIKEEDQ